MYKKGSEVVTFLYSKDIFPSTSSTEPVIEFEEPQHRQEFLSQVYFFNILPAHLESKSNWYTGINNHHHPSPAPPKKKIIRQIDKTDVYSFSKFPVVEIAAQPPYAVPSTANYPQARNTS